MAFFAWSVTGVFVGAVVGFLVESTDPDGAILGGIAGLFVAWFFHDKIPKAMESLGVPAALGVLATVGIAAWLLKNALDDEAGFVWRDAAVELRPLPGLKRVNLGETLQQATERVGAFDPDPAANPNLEPGVTNYLQRGGRIRLRVVADRITRVSYECAEADTTRLNGVACGASETRVIEVFGNGARRVCAKVDPSRPEAKLAPNAFGFDVLDNGTRYIAVLGRVRGFVVMAPPDLAEALGGDQLWHRCS